MITLWALCRDGTDEFIAAPSYEAAAAVCCLDGDSVKPWPFAQCWHADELPAFLDTIEIIGWMH